jgi:cell division protein FtsX
MGVCLGIFLVWTLLWVVTLSQQAPEFLTARDQGIFGTPLLPVFLVAIVVTAISMWAAVSGSARCLRRMRRV